MVDIAAVGSTVCQLLFLMALGFLAAKIGLMGETFTKELSNIVIRVAQPFMLFMALQGVEYSAQRLKTGLLVLALGIAVHAVLAVVAFGFSRLWHTRDERNITEFCILFVNGAFVGFPILEAALGSEGIFYGAFYVVSFNLVCWTWGLAVIGRGKGTFHFSPKKLLNFGTVPCILGVLAYALRLTVPMPLSGAMRMAGSLSTPLVLLVIGANLTRIPLSRSLRQPSLYGFAAVRLLLCPLLIAVLLRLCGIGGELGTVLTLMAALPTAAYAVVFGELFDARPDLAARCVGVTTVLCTATIPLVAFLSQWILP